MRWIWMAVALAFLAGCSREEMPEVEKAPTLAGTKWTASTDHENRQYVLSFKTDTEVATFIADGNMNMVGTKYGEGTYVLDGGLVTFDLTFKDGFEYRYLDAAIDGDMMTLRREWTSSSGASTISTQKYTKR